MMNLAGFPLIVWLVFPSSFLYSCVPQVPLSVILGLGDPVLCPLRPLPFLVISVHIPSICSWLCRFGCGFFPPLFVQPEGSWLLFFPLWQLPFAPWHCSGEWPEQCSWDAVKTRGQDYREGAGALSWLRSWGTHWARLAQAWLLERTAWKAGNPWAMRLSVEILQCGSHCSRCWLGAQGWARQTWPLLSCLQ